MRGRQRVERVPGAGISFHLQRVPIRLSRVTPTRAARCRCPVIGVADKDQGVGFEGRAGANLRRGSQIGGAIEGVSRPRRRRHQATTVAHFRESARTEAVDQ